jgi:hypothetical protein|nr:MAG TPA: hypothetical protein [Caudoviricetes sp.]
MDVKTMIAVKAIQKQDLSKCTGSILAEVKDGKCTVTFTKCTATEIMSLIVYLQKELIQAFASQDAPPDVVSHTLKALPLVALQECLEECK